MNDSFPPPWREVIWRPWRMDYIRRRRPNGCAFCEVANAGEEEDHQRYVVYRGRNHFVVLNLWPYNNGHVMICPNRHVADIVDLDDEEALDMHRLSCRLVTAYRKTMQAQGVNVGLNLGRASGGSIDHLHLHLVPRWVGDSNFMPVVGKTKVLVELLEQTWTRLHDEAATWDDDPTA